MRIPVRIVGSENKRDQQWEERKKQADCSPAADCSKRDEEREEEHNEGKAEREGPALSPFSTPEKTNAEGRPAPKEKKNSSETPIKQAPPPEINWKDQYFRLLADMENMKRHAAAERERLTALGKEAVLEDVFPLIESLERGRKAVEEATDKNTILAGLDLIYKSFLALLEKHGVERISTVGEPFDPRLHEALAMIAQPEAAPDTVVQEVRPGFRRQDRLLRPAAVVVAKAPTEKEEKKPS